MPKPTRRSPLSFLRSVKSFFLSSQPADSFVPADHPTTQLPKSFLNRVFRKPPPRPHPLCSHTQHSFFDDGDDLVDHLLDQRVLSRSRLSVSRLTDSGRNAYSTSRLSSAFAHTSPDLSSFSSAAPSWCSIAEQRDTPRSDSRTDLVSEFSQIHFLI
jgi:hypothetical protein